MRRKKSPASAADDQSRTAGSVGDTIAHAIRDRELSFLRDACRCGTPETCPVDHGVPLADYLGGKNCSWGRSLPAHHPDAMDPCPCGAEFGPFAARVVSDWAAVDW